MRKRIDPKVQGGTDVQADGGGCAVSCVVQQESNDPGGWVIEIRAMLGETDGQAGKGYTVARIVVPPRAPGSNADRLMFVGSIPGARMWRALVTPPTPAPPSSIYVDLFSASTNASIVPCNGAVISP